MARILFALRTLLEPNSASATRRAKANVRIPLLRQQLLSRAPRSPRPHPTHVRRRSQTRAQCIEALRKGPSLGERDHGPTGWPQQTRARVLRHCAKHWAAEPGALTLLTGFQECAVRLVRDPEQR